MKVSALLPGYFSVWRKAWLGSSAQLPRLSLPQEVDSEEKKMKEERKKTEQLMYPWDVAWERRKAKVMRMLKPAEVREP